MIELVTFVVIVCVIYLYIRHRSVEVDLVESPLDHHKYLVRNLPDKMQAAQLLSAVSQDVDKLIKYLNQLYPNDKRIMNLIERFDPTKITEASDDARYTSYSINKGEKIVLCVRQRDQYNELVDLNTMMFVTIHELAHLMTDSVGHTEEFWTNMNFLLKHAMSKELNVYTYQPYHTNPQRYCGIIISDTPYKI